MAICHFMTLLDMAHWDTSLKLRFELYVLIILPFLSFASIFAVFLPRLSSLVDKHLIHNFYFLRHLYILLIAPLYAVLAAYHSPLTPR